MALIADPKADLTELAQRLQNVAKALKSLPANHPHLPQEMDTLREEVLAVAMELRRSEGRGAGLILVVANQFGSRRD